MTFINVVKKIFLIRSVHNESPKALDKKKLVSLRDKVKVVKTFCEN